jgi:hypothetical protein
VPLAELAAVHAEATVGAVSGKIVILASTA